MKLLTSLLISCVCLSAVCKDRPSQPGGTSSVVPRRAVQLDLASQMETVSFVTNHMTRVAAAGCDTFVLYLEDRVRTASYPYPTEQESYSPAEIGVIVACAERLGLDLVPVISPLGHDQRFLRHKELHHFAEEREGFGRWGVCTRPIDFCLENPQARAWMETYLREVAALFPGKNFHLGFDETWDLGFCPDCRKIREREGLGKLYMRRVLWAHGVAQRMGKRMWMWDDFFAFFPEEIENLPRDIVMCCWNYCPDVDRLGVRTNFSGRRRDDALATYARLGLEAITCCWYETDNIRGLCDYTVRRPNGGQLLTHWLQEREFHGYHLPRTYAALALWQAPELAVGDRWLSAGVARAFPGADARTREAVEALVADPALALWTSAPTMNGCLDHAMPRATLQGWKTALGVLRQAPSHPGEGDVAADPLSETALLDDLAVRTEMSVLAAEARNAAQRLLCPDRLSAESRAAKDLIAAQAPRWKALCDRRERQWAAWRPGPVSETCREYHDSYGRLEAQAAAVPDVADETEWMLEVDFQMGDTYGVPMLTVEGEVDGVWTKLASGTWKARPGDPAWFPKRIPLKLEKAPTALRLTQHGYGACDVCHVSVYGRNRRLKPVRIVRTSGLVRTPENLLVDDFRVVSLGEPDGAGAVSHPEMAEQRSVVEMAVE